MFSGSGLLYQPVNLTIFAQIVNEIQITWDEYS